MPLTYIPLEDIRNTAIKLYCCILRLCTDAVSVLLTSDIIKWSRFICES